MRAQSGAPHGDQLHGFGGLFGIDGTLLQLGGAGILQFPFGDPFCTFRCSYYYDITYKAGEHGTAYDKSETRVCEFTFRHDPRMGRKDVDVESLFHGTGRIVRLLQHI